MSLKVLGLLALGTSLVNVYLAFTTKPDLVFWKWFGYDFGINYSDYTAFKILSVCLMILYIIAIEIKDEGNNDSNNSGSSYNVG